MGKEKGQKLWQYQLHAYKQQNMKHNWTVFLVNKFLMK